MGPGDASESVLRVSLLGMEADRPLCWICEMAVSAKMTDETRPFLGCQLALSCYLSSLVSIKTSNKLYVRQFYTFERDAHVKCALSSGGFKIETETPTAVG